MTPLPPPSSGTETLLIVENEAAIRNLLQMALRNRVTSRAEGVLGNVAVPITRLE